MPFPDIFFGFTHTGVDESGSIGKVRRNGRPGLTTACGALVFLTDVFAESKELEPAEGPHEDVELYELKKKLLKKVRSPESVNH